MIQAPLRILLVEDNLIDAQLLREALPGEHLEPYRLDHTTSAHLALEILDKRDTDVVLLDLVLPDSRGLETLTKVHAGAPWVPIVVLTSSDDEEMALQALKQGAQDYLSKGYVQVYRNLLGRTIRYAIERHRLLAELKGAQEQQQQLAAEEKRRAEELHQAYEDLKHTQTMLVQAEKMAAVGQLASGIAHEVKNPLTIILQGINYFEREVVPPHGQSYEISQMMKEAVMRSDRIIRGLLDFSRPVALELKPCEIESVIDASIALVEKQLTITNIRVCKEMAPELPLVMIDENQMKQVFINLILNAFQAMLTGGELHIRAYLKTLNALGHRVGHRATDFFKPGDRALVCEIQDTGKGIPETMLSKVFDPFFTTKPPGEGTGLGLAITRAIVESHRGFIVIESREGHGTTATLTLPIAYSPTRLSHNGAP